MEYRKLESNHHGMSKTRIYRTWKMMRQRCNNPNKTSYKYYGARGIKVCSEWNCKGGFCAFYNWAMENGYSEELTIDRIDVNGDYSPNNCRWATWKEQANNQRRRKPRLTLTYKGETLSLVEWSQRTGLDYHVLHRRLLRKWTPERIIETPCDSNYDLRRKH